MNMESVISRFTRAAKEEGNILLVDMPPGTGKSYASTSAIAKLIKSGDPRRVIFMTPLKKNLLTDTYDPEGNRVDGELRKAFAREGISGLYDDCVINLQPVAEHVLRTGAEMVRKGDFELLDSFLGDRKFSKAIEAYFRLALENGRSKKQFELTVDNFRPLESKLRLRIRRTLDKVAKEKAERRRYIIENLNWLRRLYPEIDVYEKKVILLSSSKFIYPFDPIIAPSGSFYELDLLNDSIIFMDEFDSIKLDWLNQLVKSNNRRRIDVVNLFTRIKSGLDNRKNHSRGYYRESDEAGLGGAWKHEGLSDIADSVAEAFKKDFQDHHLEYDFKLMSDDSGGFVFRDYNTITIGSSRRLDVEVDNQERINRIVFRDGTKGTSIETMFRHLGRRLYRFEGFMGRMAVNYKKNRDNEGNPILYEHAIRTVLEPYRLDKDQTDYLVEAIEFRHDKGGIDSDGNDMTIYANGFDYFDFEDDDSHSLNTRIHQTAYHRSPEAVLLKVLAADGVKIVGISATATLDTCIRNFDLRYLTCKPAFKEYKLSDDEASMLEASYCKATENYDQVKIVPITIDSDYEQCLSDSKEVLKILMLDLNSEDHYDKERYARFVTAYRYFIRIDDIRSMLCFMTTHPSNHGPLNEDILKRLCNAARKDEGMEPLDNPFEVLRTEGFETTKDRIIRLLSTGSKVFVVTAYQTVGAGQNLQYPVPDGVQVVQVNSFSRDEPKMKDFDAVYLDKPTNIIPALFEANDSEQLAKYLFNIGFLQAGDEISVEDAKDSITSAFKHFAGNSKAPSGFMETDSVKIGAIRDIEQAIGRMCRTNCKSPCVYVMADSRIADFMTEDLSKYGKRFNREFLALYNSLHAVAVKKHRQHREAIDRASDRANNKLSRLLSFQWHRGSMAEWTNLRDRLLRTPTSSENEGGDLVYNMFCHSEKPINRIAYREESDNGRIYATGDNLDREVSAEAARLPEILSIPGMLEHFESQGYATEFIPNNRIMCPRLFKNVYKGALGEVAGRFIFNNWGIPLSNINDPDKFEKFDFVTAGGVYVDFKHWQGTPWDLRREKSEKTLDDIFSKLAEVGGTTAVIVNVLKPEMPCRPTCYKHKKDEMTIWTIPYLYDGQVLNTEAYGKVKEIFE